MNLRERFASLTPLETNDVGEKMEALAGTLTSARERLGHLVSDLDRGVRQTLKPLEPMLDRKRPLAMGIGGLTLLMVGGALIGNAARLRRRRRNAVRFVEKARRLGWAVTRMLDKSHRGAPREPGIGREVLGAVGTVVAVTVTKRLIDRII